MAYSCSIDLSDGKSIHLKIVLHVSVLLNMYLVTQKEQVQHERYSNLSGFGVKQSPATERKNKAET